MNERAYLWLGVLALLLAGAAGYWLKAQDGPRPETITAKPQERQADGSAVAARAPPPIIPSPLPWVAPKVKPPPHQLPKGSKEERRIAVDVQPRRADCPPVHVDLSLVQDGEGGRRVVASSPDGTVIKALDMPIEAALLPAPSRPWAAGGSYDPQRGTSGVWIERDLSRLRLGADVLQGERGELQARVRVGWRW